MVKDARETSRLLRAQSKCTMLFLLTAIEPDVPDWPEGSQRSFFKLYLPRRVLHCVDLETHHF